MYTVAAVHVIHVTEWLHVWIELTLIFGVEGRMLCLQGASYCIGTQQLPCL